MQLQPCHLHQDTPQQLWAGREFYTEPSPLAKATARSGSFGTSFTRCTRAVCYTYHHCGRMSCEMKNCCLWRVGSCKDEADCTSQAPFYFKHSLELVTQLMPRLMIGCFNWSLKGSIIYCLVSWIQHFYTWG